MSVQNTTFSWDQLLEIAQNNTPQRRMRRPGQLPSSVPIPRSLHKLPPETQPPVLLYRDTNSWCPFCERVWFALEEKEIPFATEFIDLNNKPKWYTDLVPSTQVPAAKIEGELVYESKNILLALEARFSDFPLFPDDPQENAIARLLVEDAETNGFREVGYKFLIKRTFTDDHELASLQASFEANLDQLEQALAKYPGVYFLSTFSLVDIMYAPHLDRLAASLPVYRDYHIKGNPRFPNLNAWFAALNERPAFERVKTDATTFNLLLPQLFGVEPSVNPLPLEPLSEPVQYQAEAAERLSDNHSAAIGDILKNSGVQALAVSGNSSVVTDAIEFHLKLLADYLLHGDKVLLAWDRVDGKENLDPLSATVGAIALAYVRNRICAPRDMSAGAAIAFRSAVDKVLASLY